MAVRHILLFQLCHILMHQVIMDDLVYKCLHLKAEDFTGSEKCI